MAEIAAELDRLIATLGSVVDAKAGKTANRANTDAAGLKATAVGGADAIDAELASAKRSTAVMSLREAPEVEAFRNELVDGLIRVDTANQLLQLVNTVITRFLL